MATHIAHYFTSIHACVLSSRKGVEQLGRALTDMTTHGQIDVVLIETSGSSHPMPLVEFFQSQETYQLTGMLTLVDSLMLTQDYACGTLLVPQMQHNVQANIRDTTNLLVEQLMFSSHVLLTAKSDRSDQQSVELIAQSVHQVNPLIAVLAVPWGNLEFDDVMAMPPL